MFYNYIILLRPKHWIKNLLIFFPILFSPFQLQSNAILNSFIAFFLFCAAASSIYAFNDVVDYKNDKNNIRTKIRPIANGLITRKNGIFFSILLCFISLFLALILIPKIFIYLVIYILLNVLYSYIFKYIILIDIVFVSLGFLLRIITGGIATNIDQSIWTLLIISFASLSLATGKRLGHLMKNKNYLSANWSKILLQIILSISLILTLICYIAFSFDSAVIERHGNNYIWVSIIPFFVLFIRYFYISFIGKYMGDPTDAILRDIYLQVFSILWIIIIFFLIIL